jgi:hypothetical protein
MARQLALAALVTMTLIVVLLATLFDAACGFEYIPRLPAAIFLSVMVLPFALKSRLAAFICSATIFVWILGLSPVRWDHLKSFYVDAHSLQPGMTLAEVRTRMSPYLEVGKSYIPGADVPAGIFGAHMLGAPETQAEHVSRILFIPSEEYMADWCVVYPKDGIVARVEIHPD